MMNVNLKLAPQQSDAERALAEQFAALKSALPGNAVVEIERGAAFARFADAGLPTRRREAWKYTQLRTAMREAFAPASQPDSAALKCAEDALKTANLDGADRVVLIDGFFAASLSSKTIKDVSVQSLAALLEKGDASAEKLFADALGLSDPLVALNAAFAQDGAVIEIAKGAELSAPLHLVHIYAGGAPSARASRSSLVVGADAKATVVEHVLTCDAKAAYQVNDSLAIFAGSRASLDFVRLMDDAAAAQSIASFSLRVSEAASVRTFNLTSGGALSRYQGWIEIVGEGAEVHTAGVNLLRAKQHADTTLVMTHQVPGCVSRETFHAVLDDASRSVFQGRIVVEQAAQQTDAKMMTRGLMLSDEAEVDSKPELEIFADDVQCGHGATIGALDDSLLFYLRARGLPEHEAQALLVQAFIGEVVEMIADEDLRERALDHVVRWLAARRA